MKKIKLITNLSTLGVLGGGIALIATGCSCSCSKKEDPVENTVENGELHFTSKSQLEDYVKVAHYSVTYGSKDPIDADANTMQTFLKENVKVGHLADGYACKIYTNFESTPFDTFDVILRWNTTSDKLTLQCNMSFSSGGIQIVMWDKYEIASDYSSLVFISDDGSGEQSTAISKDGFAKLETHISDHFYQINYKDSSQSESGYFWRSTYDFGEELPRKDKNN